MAVSSATTALTICISQRDLASEFSLLTPKSSTLSSYFVKLPSKKKKKVSFVIRSSADWTTTTTTTDVDKSSSVESTKVPYSLISTINVEKILRGIECSYKPITDADHYARLGIQRGCPYDQVTVAYKNKCEELRSQEGLEEEKLNQKLELIKESHYILSSEEERRMYDWSLARTENTEKYIWPYEADITQIQTQMPPPREPEDEGPTRAVGYFMLAWLILSFALNIALRG